MSIPRRVLAWTQPHGPMDLPVEGHEAKGYAVYDLLRFDLFVRSVYLANASIVAMESKALLSLCNEQLPKGEGTHWNKNRPLFDTILDATDGDAENVFMNPIDFGHTRDWRSSNRDWVSECNRPLLKAGVLGYYKGMVINQSRYIAQGRVYSFVDSDLQTSPSMLHDIEPMTMTLKLHGGRLHTTLFQKIAIELGPNAFHITQI